MFSAIRPSSATIERFLRDSRRTPLSYGSAGILATASPSRRIDDVATVIGRGRDDFARAREALRAWRQFDLGWVETFPRDAPIAPGTIVAVLIRHLGFWSLNGCRVVYTLEDRHDRFGFAYGALTNHAEGGEELFEVFLDPAAGDVVYHIRATSWPQALLARLGQPVVRLLQARFRAESAVAMRRATAGQ